MEEFKNIASNGNSHNKQNRILRAKWMDYRSPSIMMVTIVTTKRLPLLGKLQGENIILTELGQKVAEEIKRIPTYNGAESIEIYSYVIMPDHVHFFCSPATNPPHDFHLWMRYWKRLVTQEVWEGERPREPLSRYSDIAAREYARPPRLWQSGCWDTQMRMRDQYENKWLYVRNNPVRKGLSESADDWLYQGVVSDLQWHD